MLGGKWRLSVSDEVNFIVFDAAESISEIRRYYALNVLLLQ
jgi:hypothetical protein